MRDLASRLKQVRGKRSAKEFAALMGCSMQTVYRYEWGERLPDERFLQEVAEKTGVSLDWLKGEDLDQLSPVEKSPRKKISLSARQYCSELETRLDKAERKVETLEDERRELAAENRRLYQEKEMLLREKEAMLRENGSLREKIARLEGDLARTPSLFDEHHATRPSEESASHSDV
ncbi:MAG TPA: helix-turn-helix domain-containing protein [Candidatus Desulfovibrio gallistercoris]|nr:helix-turn-helix domain-containing protein [Candidatus Desulfovibrio gallistercoris]